MPIFYAFASDFKIPAAVHRFGCHRNKNSILLFSSCLQCSYTAFQTAFDLGHCM